jgi:hypothetical protein
MTAAALVRLGVEALPANVVEVIARAAPIMVIAGPAPHKAATNAATVPVVKGPATAAGRVIRAINASAVNRQRPCPTLALLCFPTTKASNHSLARFA